jgi:hypothetical protein
MTVNFSQLLELRVDLIFLLRAMFNYSVGHFFLLDYSKVDGIANNSESEGMLVDESKTD